MEHLTNKGSGRPKAALAALGVRHLGDKMYDIEKLAEKEAELKSSFHEHFVAFFKSFDYTDISETKVKIVDVE